MHVGEQGSTWIEVGSIKPESASEPVWIRSKAIALAIQQKLYVAEGWLIRKELFPSKTGLIISFEAPTPGNDWLSTISRILHLVLLDQGSPTDCFARVFVQLTNAATLRRLMGLCSTRQQQEGERGESLHVPRQRPIGSMCRSSEVIPCHRTFRSFSEE